jgi:hypothetical protein
MIGLRGRGGKEEGRRQKEEGRGRGSTLNVQRSTSNGGKEEGRRRRTED